MRIKSERLEGAVQEIAAAVRKGGQVRVSAWCAVNWQRLGYGSVVGLLGGVRTKLDTHPAFKPLHHIRGVLYAVHPAAAHLDRPMGPPDTQQPRPEPRLQRRSFTPYRIPEGRGPDWAARPTPAIRLSDSYALRMATVLDGIEPLAPMDRAGLAGMLAELVALRKRCGVSVGNRDGEKPSQAATLGKFGEVSG